LHCEAVSKVSVIAIVLSRTVTRTTIIDRDKAGAAPKPAWRRIRVTFERTLR
jgi:hypothetical protein